MADAEMIPLGTRGRPGRGTGSSKPSSAARDAGRVRRRRARRSRRRRREADPSSAPSPTRREPAEPEPADRAPRPPDAAIGAGSRPAPRPAAPARSGARPDRRDPGRRLGAGADLAPPREVFGDGWEQRLAEFLAFLRRRVTGDFEVDEYGFDPEITERFLLAAVRPLKEKWFRVEVRGAENIPDRGRRAGGLQPLRHGPGRRADDDGRRSTTRPAATCGRSAPTWCSGCRSSASWPARAAPRWPATRTPSGCSAAASWSGSGPRASRASASPTPSATSCSGSAAAGFVSAAIRTGVPIVPVLGGRRRGDLPAGRQRAVAGPAARHPLPADHAVLPAGSGRSAWCRCRRSGSSSSASRSAPTPTTRARPTTRCWSST